MEQRLGRIARAGSRHQHVHSYAIHPPASAEEIVRIETILRQKMCAAGIATPEFPSLKGWRPSPSRAGVPAISEAIRNELQHWGSASACSCTTTIACAVASVSPGFLALVLEADRVRLVASIDGVVTEEPGVVLEAIQHGDGADRTLVDEELQRAAHELRAYFDTGHALDTARVSSNHAAKVRNASVRRLNRLVQRARAHSRDLKAIEAESARAVLLSNLNAHQEMELERVRTIRDDDKWANQVAAIGMSERAARSGPAEIKAILLLGQGLA